MDQCTAGHEGAVGVISCMSIFSACFVLLTSRQLAATTWSGQIWISCWILPHFDVRTISVAWKLKKLSNIFWQKIFFLLHPFSKGVAPLYSTVQYSTTNTFTQIRSLKLFKLVNCVFTNFCTIQEQVQSACLIRVCQFLVDIYFCRRYATAHCQLTLHVPHYMTKATT